MSRIGKKPVTVPQGVTLDLKGSEVAVKGPKGELRRQLHPEMQLALANGFFTVTRPSEEQKHKALHGLTRTLVQNMIDGVSKGFTKTLEIQGVGYKAEAKPYGVNLVVGFSHPVKYEAPKGIKISVENNTTVKIEGADKEKVGQVAAELRAVRPPEPYKGKGVRYQGEQIRRKAGKTGAKYAMRTIHAPKGRSQLRYRRHLRVRQKVAGTGERPRLVVFRSLKHIYAQLVNDDLGVTLLAVGDSGKEIKVEGGGKVARGKAVGKLLAEKAKAAGVTRVVFDRAGYRYHGRVQAVADGAREGGLEF